MIVAASTYNNDFIQIRTSAGTNAQIQNVYGTRITSLKISQNLPVASPLANGIHSFGAIGVNIANGVFIDNVVVSGVGGNGILLEGQGGEHYLSQVTVRGAWLVGISVGSDCVLSNLIIGGNGRNGTAAGLTFSNSTVSNVKSYGNGGRGIDIEASSNGFALSNAIVESNGAAGVSVRFASSFAGTITNVKSLGNGTTVTNALVDRTGLTLADGTNVTVTGGFYGQTGQTTQLVGIYIPTGSDYSLVGVTVGKNQQAGIQVDSTASYVTLVGVTSLSNGQAATNTYPDVQVGGQHIKVADSIFHSVTANKTNYGIQEVTGASLNSYINNDFSGQATGQLSLLAGSNSAVWRALQSRVVLTYGATIATDASLGSVFVTTITDGNAMTLGLPTNPSTGQVATWQFRNTFGAAGVLTFNAVFKLGAAWVQPANGFSRAITFVYDGTNWVETGRTAADVAN
jgi:hypothetical protein